MGELGPAAAGASNDGERVYQLLAQAYAFSDSVHAEYSWALTEDPPNQAVLDYLSRLAAETEPLHAQLEELVLLAAIQQLGTPPRRESEQLDELAEHLDLDPGKVRSILARLVFQGVLQRDTRNDHR